VRQCVVCQFPAQACCAGSCRARHNKTSGSRVAGKAVHRRFRLRVSSSGVFRRRGSLIPGTAAGTKPLRNTATSSFLLLLPEMPHTLFAWRTIGWACRNLWFQCMRWRAQGVGKPPQSRLHYLLRRRSMVCGCPSISTSGFYNGHNTFGLGITAAYRGQHFQLSSTPA